MNKTTYPHTPSVSSEQAENLLARLSPVISESVLRAVLEAFEIAGLLDTEQLQQVTGLDRMPLARLLEKIERLRMGLPAIFVKLEQEVRRPTTRGRSPKVYLLGESGAALLRWFGSEEAHACQLNDETAMSHALGLVDFHLAAHQAGLRLLTDRTISYGDDRVLRPDHQILGEKIQIFEIEQVASREILRRIVSSLEHKQSFFESSQSSAFAPTVLMLLQLKRGPEWEQTCKTWRQAVHLVQEKLNKAVNFRLLTLPLSEFLSRPDWAGTVRQDWLDLTKSETGIVKGQQATPPVPAQLAKLTSREDQLILAALWQDFLENAEKRLAEYPRPDPAFLHLIRLIYTASFDTALPVFDQAGFPHGSLYLLNRYLSLRDLRPLLNKAIHAGRGSLRWNPTTIRHRMQVVANIFLGAHGWRTDGPLFVNALVNSWDSNDGRAFNIAVEVRNPQILRLPGENLMPTSFEIQRTEQALSWVIWAFFAYSVNLGLGRVEFW